MNHSDHTIAVITAAVAAFLGGDTNFVVKSIRRVPEKINAWTMADRRKHKKTWRNR